MSAGLDRTTDARVDVLQMGGLAVAASLDASYRQLDPPAQHAFRLMAVADCAELGLPTAAAMIGPSADVARPLLEHLVDVNLLDTTTPGRYRYHDLLRLFARDRSRSADTGADRAAALLRLGGLLLAATKEAERVVRRGRPTVTPGQVARPGRAALEASMGVVPFQDVNCAVGASGAPTPFASRQGALACHDRRVVAGYGGVYRAMVLDDVDPMRRYRLQVRVPEVFGEVPVWAAASLPVGAGHPLPVVGEMVSVSFERGDTDYPVWEHAVAAEGRAAATGGYLGKYHGVVTDTDDPLHQRRLQVSVPEVDPTPAWAVAAGGVADGFELPPVGSGVWVEYDNGDPSHPRWVGLT